MRVLLSALVVLLCACAARAGISHWLDPSSSKTPTFRTQGLHGVTSTTRLDEVSGAVHLFADFNQDKYVDLFVVSSDKRSVEIRMWSSSTWTFEVLQGTNVSESFEIVNLAASDMQHRGRVDLLVTVKVSEGLYATHVYWSDGDGNFEGNHTEVTGLTDHPLLFDQNGDMFVDLLAPTQNGTAVWINLANKSFSKPTYPGYGNLTSPHSASFVDFDGDCHGDVFLSVEGDNETVYEIWTWSSKKTYSLAKSIIAPTGAAQVSFADFDRDGTIDLIIPVCVPEDTCANSSIYIVYNDQKTRTAKTQCSSDAKFSMSLTSADGYVVIEQSVFEDLEVVLAPGIAEAPLTLRSGDYNLDGFPDIIVPVLSANGTRTAQLWENTDCTSKTCTTAADKSGRRTFKYVSSNTDALKSIKNVYSAAFFDLGEDGSHDIIVLSSPSSGVYNTSALFNNFKPDALFVKASGLNGVCTLSCSGGNPSPRPYGVNYPGGTWKFAATNSGGNLVPIAAPQLYHSGHLSLLTPYVMVGLGRISNYLDSVTYGVSSKYGAFSYYWESVIPNSQLVAIPYKIDKPSGWTLLMFVEVGNIIFWVIMAMVIVLVGLGSLLIYFSVKERKEDQQQKEEDRHKFDFNL